jgi:predicted  nucleic acid-binding Zn-ribbon protein
MKHLIFQKFIDLITFDKKCHELKEQSESAQALIDQSLVLRKTYSDAILAASHKKDLAYKTSQEIELEIKTLEEKEKKQKSILEQVANVKEQKAAFSELETLQYQHNELEKNLTRAWNRYEMLLEESKAVEKEANESIQRVDAEIAKNQAVISEAVEESRKYTTDRTAKLEGINPEWLRMYEIMKARSKNPVAPVLHESCSVCFYMVSAQDLQKLHQSDLLQCKDCYRLLYIPEETQVAPASVAE